MSLDRSIKAELHVEDDVGVPLDLFEALRYVGTEEVGPLGSSLRSESSQSSPALDAADQVLVDAYNDSYNSKSGGRGGRLGNRRYGGGKRKPSVFRKTSAIRSKRGRDELKKQKSWMMKTRYLDNSFESSVSSVVTKDEEERRLDAVRRAKLAKIRDAQSAKSNKPASERINEQFEAARAITVETAKHPNHPDKIRAVEVLDLLPDQAEWLKHHVTVYFTRKPFSKERERNSIRSGILQGIPPAVEDTNVDEDEVGRRMMLVVPDNADALTNTSTRSDDNVYRWKNDFVFEVQPDVAGHKNMVLRQEAPGQPFLYTLSNRRLKFNKAGNRSDSNGYNTRDGARVLVKRRRDYIPFEEDDRAKKRKELEPQ